MKQQLGEFEETVLLAVRRLGNAAYGVSIRNMIAVYTRRSVSSGALSATLSRLEEKGLVRSRVAEPTPERGGRAKQYYEIEETGEKALAEVEAARRQLREGRQADRCWALRG